MKYMWVIAAIFIAILFVFGRKCWPDAPANPANRFEITYYQAMDANEIQILLDKETGVKYLLWKYGRGGGAVKLEEKEVKTFEKKAE